LYLALIFSASVTFAQSEQTKAINVDVIYPNASKQSETLTLTGTVEAKQNAFLAPLVSGLVADIYVEIGDKIKKGQALLQLDTRLIELEVQEAQANLSANEINVAEAKRLYDEVLALSKKQVVAQTLIAERRAFVANLQAQVARARAVLERQQEVLRRHRLVAQRNVDVGEWVSQQSSLLNVVSEQDLRLSFSVPQQYFNRFNTQETVALTVLPNTPNAPAISASLSRLVPVTDSVSRTFTAQADLPQNIQGVSELSVGMSAQVELDLPNSSAQYIELPRSAIKQHPDGGSSVFVVDNNKAKRIITDYSMLANGNVSVQSTQTKLAYIVTGIELLSDGTPVIPNTIRQTR
jgi:RND family efflux transporter MFP subunit